MKFKRTGIILGVILLTLSMSAGSCEEDSGGAQETGQKQTEQAFKQQSEAVPYPVDQLKDSLERRNLKEKLLRTNDPEKIGYVYLLNYGKVLGYYTIKGKVSSTQSMMTTDQLIVDKCSADYCPVVVNAPGDDGSYGPNEDGVFFFTTEDAYITTTLDYIYSDQPIPFNVPQLSE